MADDDYYSLLAVQTLLEQYSLEVSIAHGGQEAIKKVKLLHEEKGVTFDLIIMDLRMPICDGIKATSGIRDFLNE